MLLSLYNEPCTCVCVCLCVCASVNCVMVCSGNGSLGCQWVRNTFMKSMTSSKMIDETPRNHAALRTSCHHRAQDSLYRLTLPLVYCLLFYYPLQQKLCTCLCASHTLVYKIRFLVLWRHRRVLDLHCSITFLTHAYVLCLRQILSFFFCDI